MEGVSGRRFRSMSPECSPLPRENDGVPQEGVSGVHRSVRSMSLTEPKESLKGVS